MVSAQPGVSVLVRCRNEYSQKCTSRLLRFCFVGSKSVKQYKFIRNLGTCLWPYLWSVDDG